MSARSLLLASAVIALVSSCGKKEKTRKGPKGSMDRVGVLAKFMHDNVPRPGVVGDCKDEDYVGGYPVNYLTILKLAKATYENDPEHADWMSPAALEATSVKTLLDPKASAEDKAYAAGEFTNAPFFVVYRVENVDAPIALGVKELKIGTISTKIIKYGKDTIPICARAFSFQNSKDKSDWAIEKSDKALIDPLVAKAMKDDITALWIKLAPKANAYGQGAPPDSE